MLILFTKLLRAGAVVIAGDNHQPCFGAGANIIAYVACFFVEGKLFKAAAVGNVITGLAPAFRGSFYNDTVVEAAFANVIFSKAEKLNFEVVIGCKRIKRQGKMSGNIAVDHFFSLLW